MFLDPDEWDAGFVPLPPLCHPSAIALPGNSMAGIGGHQMTVSDPSGTARGPRGVRQP